MLIDIPCSRASLFPRRRIIYFCFADSLRIQQVEKTFELEMATENVAEKKLQKGDFGMAIIVFNDCLTLVKKLGDERDCPLHYLAHISLEEIGRPFEIEKRDENTVDVQGTALITTGWSSQHWLLKFMTKFELNQFVEVANNARSNLEKGPSQQD